MDGDGVLSQEVEHADLQQPPVSCRSDEHCQVVVQDDVAYGVGDSVSDVVVSNAVVPGWLTDPHLDNIACLAYNVRGRLGAIERRLRASPVPDTDRLPGLRDWRQP